MSQNNRFKIPKLDDIKIVAAFSEFARDVGAPQLHAQPFGSPSPSQWAVEAPLPPELSGVVSKSSHLLHTIGTNASGLSVNLYRGGYPTQDFAPSAIYDEVVINGSHSTVPANISLRAIDKLQKALKAFEPKRVSELSGEENLAQLAALHSATLDRLETIASNLVIEYDEKRRNLIQEFEQKNLAADTNLQNKAASLATDYEKKAAQLAQKEEHFEKRRQELDDKDNTHARRQIQRQLLSEIKARQNSFQLTPGTVTLRRPVRYALIALISILVVAVFVSWFQFAISSQTDLASLSLLAGKATLSTIAVVLAILFYARWENKWAERHADAEFATKQFELDIERASWLVETTLEWRDKNGTLVPERLIDPLAANLFTYGHANQDDPLKHPADQLASALFGAASKANLRLGDHEVEIDPKKIKPKAKK